MSTSDTRKMVLFMVIEVMAHWRAAQQYEESDIDETETPLIRSSARRFRSQIDSVTSSATPQPIPQPRRRPAQPLSLLQAILQYEQQFMPRPFTSLPIEVITNIVNQVEDKEDSACLGLTCKAAYIEHFAIHGPVRIFANTSDEVKASTDQIPFVSRIENFVCSTGVYRITRCSRSFITYGMKVEDHCDLCALMCDITTHSLSH